MIVKETSASLLIAACAVTALIAGIAPSSAQSPAPTITINGESAASTPPPAKETQASPAAAPSAKVVPAGAPSAAPVSTKKKSAEVLPWADKPLTPVTAAATGDVAATEAAAAQCSSLFEAACRDLKTCAWIADVALQDGTQVPARCMARPPAPPKKAAAKKQTAPKKAAAAPAETSSTTTAPAVKASVTRIEDEQPPVAKAKKVEEEKAAAVAEPEPEAQPTTPAATADVETPKESEKPKEAVKQADSANAPIVVKPPPAAPNPTSQMPSFGSASPIMPGGDSNAVVVTVPPSE